MSSRLQPEVDPGSAFRVIIDRTKWNLMATSEEIGRGCPLRCRSGSLDSRLSALRMFCAFRRSTAVVSAEANSRRSFRALVAPIWDDWSTFDAIPSR